MERRQIIFSVSMNAKVSELGCRLRELSSIIILQNVSAASVPLMKRQGGGRGDGGSGPPTFQYHVSLDFFFVKPHLVQIIKSKAKKIK